MKVAYSSDDSVKAVLLKDKTAKAEPASKPQQYIEVQYIQIVALLCNHGNYLYGRGFELMLLSCDVFRSGEEGSWPRPLR